MIFFLIFFKTFNLKLSINLKLYKKVRGIRLSTINVIVSLLIFKI